MGQFLLGFQVLLRVWSDAAFAGQIAPLLGGSPPSPAPKPAPAPPATPTVIPEPERAPVPVPVPTRSEAVTLLSVLQREGRLVDFLKEPISSFSDAEIGAAVRPVHKDCAAVMERIFGVEPLSAVQEGQSIEVLANHDPAQFRIVGAGASAGTVRGTVVHPGWKATRRELPTYSGKPDSAMVLAPVEVEV